jgi:hypothetical protein
LSSPSLSLGHHFFLGHFFGSSAMSNPFHTFCPCHSFMQYTFYVPAHDSCIAYSACIRRHIPSLNRVILLCPTFVCSKSPRALHLSVCISHCRAIKVCPVQARKAFCGRFASRLVVYLMVKLATLQVHLLPST